MLKKQKLSKDCVLGALRITLHSSKAMLFGGNIQNSYGNMVIDNNEGPKSNFVIYKHLVYKFLPDLPDMRN